MEALAVPGNIIDQASGSRLREINSRYYLGCNGIYDLRCQSASLTSLWIAENRTRTAAVEAQRYIDYAIRSMHALGCPGY